MGPNQRRLSRAALLPQGWQAIRRCGCARVMRPARPKTTAGRACDTAVTHQLEAHSSQLRRSCIHSFPCLCFSTVAAGGMIGWRGCRENRLLRLVSNPTLCPCGEGRGLWLVPKVARAFFACEIYAST